MPRLKYDYPTMKIEFFKSDYRNVKSFLQDRYQRYTSSMRENTIGWAYEKQAYKESVFDEALKKLRDESSELLKNDLNRILSEVHIRLSNMSSLTNISNNNLITYCYLFMTLNGRPTKYVDQEVLNQMQPVRATPDELTPEEKESVHRMMENLNLLPNNEYSL